MNFSPWNINSCEEALGVPVIVQKNKDQSRITISWQFEMCDFVHKSFLTCGIVTWVSYSVQHRQRKDACKASTQNESLKLALRRWLLLGFSFCTGKLRCYCVRALTNLNAITCFVWHKHLSFSITLKTIFLSLDILPTRIGESQRNPYALTETLNASNLYHTSRDVSTISFIFHTFALQVGRVFQVYSYRTISTSSYFDTTLK